MDDLVMRLDRLEPRPVCLPRGFEIRAFQAGDEEKWVEIQTAADELNLISRGLYDSEFRSRHPELEERQLFAYDENGVAAGTVTAWLPEPDVDPSYGRLHWLAVLPPCRRRGLGAALVGRTIARLLELGHERAYLTTSGARTEAIRLYERFGFQVVPRGAVVRRD